MTATDISGRRRQAASGGIRGAAGLPRMPPPCPEIGP